MKNFGLYPLLGTSLLAALAGCDVSVGKCKRDDAGECIPLFPDDDGGGFPDDDDGGADGSTAPDGGDAGHAADGGGDAAAKADGGTDGGGPASDAGSDAGEVREPLSLREFCEAALAPGQAWADQMDQCCSSVALGSSERTRLLALFGYPAGGPSDCEDRQQALVDSGNVTFDGKYAAACAEAIAANYMQAPPDACPTGDGYFLPELEAQVGHGVQTPQQIPVCRKAFVGKLQQGADCTSDLHCAGTRVCRSSPGGGQTCQDPVPEAGTCEDAFDCTAGTVCVGNDSSAGGKRCNAVDSLGLNTAKCTRSTECVVGLVCDADTQTCTQASMASTYKASGAACEEQQFECRGFCDPSSHKCADFCPQ